MQKFIYNLSLLLISGLICNSLTEAYKWDEDDKQLNNSEYNYGEEASEYDYENEEDGLEKRSAPFGSNLQPFEDLLEGVEGVELELFTKSVNVSNLKNLRNYLRSQKYTANGYICSKLDWSAITQIKQSLEQCQTDWGDIYDKLIGQLGAKENYKFVGNLFYRAFDRSTIFENEKACADDGGKPLALPRGEAFDLFARILSKMNKPDQYLIVYVQKYSKYVGTFLNGNHAPAKLLAKITDNNYKGYFAIKPKFGLDSTNAGVTVELNSNSEKLIGSTTYKLNFICQYSANSQWGRSSELLQLLYAHIKQNHNVKKRSIAKFVPVKDVISRIVTYISSLTKLFSKPTKKFGENCLLDVTKNVFPEGDFSCPTTQDLNKNGEFRSDEASALIKKFISFIKEVGEYYPKFVDTLKDLKKVIPATDLQRLGQFFEKFTLSLPQNSLFLATLIICVIVLIYCIAISFLYCKLKFGPQDHKNPNHPARWRNDPPRNNMGPYRAVSQQTSAF